MSAPLLKVATLVGALLACVARPCAGGSPFANGGGQGGQGGDGQRGEVHPALAAAGDWFKAEHGHASVAIAKGDGNPTICRGEAVVMKIDLSRTSSTGSGGNGSSSGGGDSTDNTVFFSYSKSKFRDCTEKDLSSTSSSSFSSSLGCCSDKTLLRGYSSLADVGGTFTVSQDRKKLAHAKAKVKVPLYESSSTSSYSSGGGGEPDGTAVVDLRVDCVTLNERETSTDTDSCKDGNCVIIKGQTYSVQCRAKFGDAKISGTVELQGLVKLQVGLSSPPPGYAAAGWLHLRTSSEKAFE